MAPASNASMAFWSNAVTITTAGAAPPYTPDYFEAAHHRHLKIEKNQIGPQCRDLQQRLLPVLSFANDFDFRNKFKFLSNYAACDRLIVYDQSPHVALAHPFDCLAQWFKSSQQILADGIVEVASGLKLTTGGAQGPSAPAHCM